MMRPFVALSFAALIAAGTAAGQDNASSLIQHGLEVYANAQSLAEHDARAAAFAHAERLFGQAARRGGGNADLYANAGTAALQAERLGPAVLAFRRALSFDPDHARSRRNLAHARSLLPAWVPKRSGDSLLDSFFFWHRSLSTYERAGAGAICFVLAALGFAVATSRRSRLARGLALLPALAWAGLITSLAVEARAGGEREAVITAEETPARASDSVNAPMRFSEPLPGGTEVQVIEARDRWVRIRLANGRDAWVSSQSLERVQEHED